MLGLILLHPFLDFRLPVARITLVGNGMLAVATASALHLLLRYGLIAFHQTCAMAAYPSPFG